MMAFNSQLVLAYLLGGVTFLPLCFLVFVLTLWISLPARGSLLPPAPSSDAQQTTPLQLQQQQQDGTVDDDKKRRKGHSSSSNSSTSSGSPRQQQQQQQQQPQHHHHQHHHHHHPAKVLLQSDPRLNREGYFRVSRTPRLGPATESISDYMSNMLFQKNARPKDSVYATLRYDTLYLYESDQRREDKGVLKMTNYTVAIYPANLPDNEIFNKDHPIVIRPKNKASGGSSGSSSTTLPPSSPDPQQQPLPPAAAATGAGAGPSMQDHNAKQQRRKSRDGISVSQSSPTLINGALPRPSSASSSSTNVSVASTQQEDADQDSYYIFIQSPVVKEDWYLALLGASKLQKPGTRQKVRDRAHFDPEALNNLVQTLHSSKHHEQTRWFNAFLGRVFLSIYKTQKVKDYFIQKITRKSLKLKRPSFLGQIKVRSFDVGNSIPFITRTRLNDLDASGELTAEFHLDYKGGVRVEIEVDVGIGLTSIKPVKLTVVLAVLVKAISGMMTLRIKAPPTNRFWLGFQEPPTMDIVIEPIVADKAIKMQMVLNAIETKIREAMVEAIVLPNMDDYPFFDSHGRGGVFEGDEVIGSPSSSALSPEERGEQEEGIVEGEEEGEEEEEEDDEDTSDEEDEHASAIFSSDPFGTDKVSRDGIGIAGGIAPGMVRQHSSRSNGGFSEGKGASIASAPTILSESGPASLIKRRSYHAGMGVSASQFDVEHDVESRGGGQGYREQQQQQQQPQQQGGSSSSITTNATASTTGTTTSKWMAKIKQFSGNHFNRSTDSLSDSSSSKLNTKPTVATSTATAVRTTANDLQHRAVRKASKINESIPKLAASVHMPEAGEVLHEKVARVLGNSGKSQGSHSTVVSSSASKDGKQQILVSSPLSGSPLHGPSKKTSTSSLKRLSLLESPTGGDEESSTTDSPGTDYTNTSPVQSFASSTVRTDAENSAGGGSGGDPLALLLDSSGNGGSAGTSARSGFDTFPRTSLSRKRQSAPISGVVATTTATTATISSSIPTGMIGSSSFVGIAGILDDDLERASSSKIFNTDPQHQHQSISASTSTGSVSSLPSAASHLEQVLSKSDEAAEALRSEGESTKGSSSSTTTATTTTPAVAGIVTAVPIAFTSGGASSSEPPSDGGRESASDRGSMDLKFESEPVERKNGSGTSTPSHPLQHRRSKTLKESKVGSKKSSASTGGTTAKSHQRQGSLPFLGTRGSNPLQGKAIERPGSTQSVPTPGSAEEGVVVVGGGGGGGGKKRLDERIRESAQLPPRPPGMTLARTASLGDLSAPWPAERLGRGVNEDESDRGGGGKGMRRRSGTFEVDDEEEEERGDMGGRSSSPMSSFERASTTDSEGRSSTRSSSSARSMISNFFKDSSALKSQAATAFSETKARVKRRMEERRMSEDDPLLSGRMRPGD